MASLIKYPQYRLPFNFISIKKVIENKAYAHGDRNGASRLDKCFSGMRPIQHYSRNAGEVP